MLATMRRLGLIVVWCALAMASGAALSAPYSSGPVLAQARSVEPLGAVLKRIEQRFPGRALDARLNEREDPPVYRVKWLGDDGKVREVTADARTGRILDVR